ncbi:alpha-L-arabinofuranosidase C-terminal domain-containing protein [Pelagicoccus sp. SDUM812003]|nr:alpha-L-arabinofuranosidase C-terminal domain-containing protein [Pelagicoccus sp. SDUM812003]
MDEWGFWEPNGTGAYGLEQTYTWNHALGTACFLNLFQRHADTVGMATWAQTVNVLAPLMTDETNVVCQTVYYPMALYRELCGSQSVKSDVDCHGLPDTDGLPMLDVSSSIDEAGETLSIAIVNRSETEQAEIELSVKGAEVRGEWTAHELNASSIHDVNTLEEQDKEVVQYSVRTLPKGSTSYLAPAHSITILKVGLAR